jgi:subtilisin-like proprotein convertase family protein
MKRSSRPQPVSRHQRSAKLGVEPLEDRRLLAVVQVVDGDWIAADGGLKDVSSGLVWSQRFLQNESWGLSTYDGAAQHSSALVEGGYDDWRLPTAAELQEAASHGILNHIGADFFAANQLIKFWSSDAYKSKGSSGHVAVALFDGTTSNYGDASVIDAIAVRGTRTPAAYSAPNIRVFSELAYAKESEAGLVRITIALDTKPTSSVQIPVSVSDPNQVESLPPSSLTFTTSNWNVPQAITVSVKDDAFYNPDHEFTIDLGKANSTDANYRDRDPSNARIIVRDNERPIVFATPVDRTVSENGDAGFFQVRLGAMPQGTVYVQIDSLDPSEGAAPPAALVFTPQNWNVTQTVTISGVDDAETDADQVFQVRASIRPESSPEFLVGDPQVQLAMTCIDDDGIRQTYSSGNIQLAIPDPGTVTSSIEIPQPNDGYTQIGDLNVTLNINHPRLSEVTVTLIAPDGRRFLLINPYYVSGANLVNTTLDDEAEFLAFRGAAPYTGAFQPGWDYPRTLLSDLDGSAVAGTWKLEVVDGAKRDRGTLVNWSLNISRIPPPMQPSTAALDAALLWYLTENSTDQTRRK